MFENPWRGAQIFPQIPWEGGHAFWTKSAGGSPILCFYCFFTSFFFFLEGFFVDHLTPPPPYVYMIVLKAFSNEPEFCNILSIIQFYEQIFMFWTNLFAQL